MKTFDDFMKVLRKEATGRVEEDHSYALAIPDKKGKVQQKVDAALEYMIDHALDHIDV